MQGREETRLKFIGINVTEDLVGVQGQDPEKNLISEVCIQQSLDIQNPRGTDVKADILRMGL
jgi:hypothetical protein